MIQSALTIKEWWMFVSSFSPVIIVVGFSRPHALSRALNSVNNAVYEEDVKLIISLDGGSNQEVQDVADQFNFKHGTLEVIKRSFNLGLKRHIFECCDLVNEYGSVILIEDDIVVDKYFYKYAQEALSFYKEEESVAGISLYSPEFNEFSGLPFVPLLSESDTYFMQAPCSWGQAWSKKQWNNFRNWIEAERNSESAFSSKLPDYVKEWKDSSWKKLYFYYLCGTDKYFVYPYKSYTTNVSDPGGFHNVTGSSLVQVSFGHQDRYWITPYFSEWNTSAVVYDSFMENCGVDFLSQVGDIYGINGTLTLDLYGIKPVDNINGYDYCISIKKPEKILKEFGCSFRPVETNILFNEHNSNETTFFYLFESRNCRFLTDCTKYEGLVYWSRFDFIARKYCRLVLLALFRKAVRYFS